MRYWRTKKQERITIENFRKARKNRMKSSALRRLQKALHCRRQMEMQATKTRERVLILKIYGLWKKDFSHYKSLAAIAQSQWSKKKDQDKRFRFHVWKLMRRKRQLQKLYVKFRHAKNKRRRIVYLHNWRQKFAERKAVSRHRRSLISQSFALWRQQSALTSRGSSWTTKAMEKMTSMFLHITTYYCHIILM